MRKLLCPQCKIAGLYVKNEKKERLLVYVSDEGEVVPKNLEENMEGFTFIGNQHVMEFNGKEYRDWETTIFSYLFSLFIQNNKLTSNFSYKFAAKIRKKTVE